MATTDHPIATPLELGRDGLDQPQPNLFLHASSGPATYRHGADALVAGWRQDRVDDTAARTSRRVFIEVA